MGLRTQVGTWNIECRPRLPDMALQRARNWLTKAGVFTSRPAAFGLFAIYGVLWIAFGDGLKWHPLATLATWGMTLLIQRAEHRDTQALHAKLDELLKVHGDAKDSLMDVDDKDAEEVERERARVRTRPSRRKGLDQDR